MTPPLPIVYLHVGGGQSIDGAIRFQKLVFLGQHESKVPEHYRFVPYKYGPYSYRLRQEIESCIDAGYITKRHTDNEAGNYRVDYSITQKGIQYAQELQKVDGMDRIFRNIHEIKKKYNGWNISRLLKYVYRKYPDYTDESTLDIERLFTESTTSQFLEQDDGHQGPFDQIETLEETEGRLAGTDNSFTRQLIEIGSHLQVNLERFEDDSLSIYWRSPKSFNKYVQAVRDDSSVPADAPSEMRIEDSRDWIRGENGSLLENAQSEACLFFRTQAENQKFTLTWERGGGDRQHEVTLHVSGDEVDYQSLRAALARYVAATTSNIDTISGTEIGVIDDKMSESLRQTAKFAVS